MSPRNAPAATVAVCLALLVAAPVAAQVPNPPSPTVRPATLEGPYLVDDRGRRLKVRFDPGNRWWFATAWGGGLSPASGASVEAAPWQLSTGLDLRGDCEPDAEGCWKTRHGLLHFRLRPLKTDGRGRPETDGALFSGEYIRHRHSPHVSIPTIPPRRLFVPFDFGVAVRAGGLHLRHAPSTAESLWDVELLDLRMLFEFWRSERVGSMLFLGLGTRYDLFVTDADGEVSLEHVLSPFTAASLTFRHEWAEGRQRAELVADFHPFWSSRRGMAAAFDASALYAATLLALNDQPVSVTLRVDYRYGSFPHLAESTDNALQLMAGLELGIE